MASRLRASMRAPPRVANSKSRGGRPDRNAGARNASPGHEISLSYYVPKCDVQSGFQRPYLLSWGERERRRRNLLADEEGALKKTREKG